MKMEPGSSQRCRDGTRGSGHKLKYKEFSLNEKTQETFFSVGVGGTSCPGRLNVSVLEMTSSTCVSSGGDTQSPAHPVPADHAWSRGIGLGDQRPVPVSASCDFMMFYLFFF